MVEWRVGRWMRGVIVVASVCLAQRVAAVPSVETGVAKRAANDVRLVVGGMLDATEWGTPGTVRMGAGNAVETLDVAAFATPRPGRLAYRGTGVVRSLKLDLVRGRFAAKLGRIGPVFYEEPLWLTLDPGVAWEFALPVTVAKPRTRIGGKVVHPLDGLAFAPWEDGQDPTQGAQTDQKQIDRRLKKIARYTRSVRTYGSTNGLELVPERTQALGLGVVAGAWIGPDPTANQTEIAALVGNAQAGLVDLAVVGNEALLRGDVTEAQLLAYLQQVRDALAGTSVPVTTAEPWEVWLAHPLVLAAVDVVAAHVYPYWEGIAVDSAMGAFTDHYAALVAAAAGKEVVVAETGWPSAGDAVGAAVPSPENAAHYFAAVRSWARAERARVFYFSAFDEAWKATVEGPQGAHWGIADTRGRLKAGMRAALAGRTVAKTWASGPIGGPGDPTVQVTRVPEYGTFEDLAGRVSHVVPRDYGIVAYLFVGGGWWVKPRDTAPVTPIGPTGAWSIDVTTGGQDELATHYTVFLIPLTYAPPLLLGAGTLPQELYDNAAAVIDVDRPPPS